jgi:hypothetical protein
MRKPPYPFTPQPVARSWYDCHPGWKIVIGGLVVVLFLGVAVGFVVWSNMAGLRASSVVQEATARALANPQAISELGEPVRPGRFVYGKLRTRGEFGFADFDVPLEGSRSEGIVSGLAFRIRGQWHFRRLEVGVVGFPSIDLLQAGDTK